MSFPVFIYANDGWIEKFESNNELVMWNLGSLKRYIAMGLYFLDSKEQIWVASSYCVLRKPKISERFSMLAMGLSPMSEIALRVKQIQEDGISKFKCLILSNPPKKRVRFRPEEIETLKNVSNFKDLSKIMRNARVPVSR